MSVRHSGPFPTSPREGVRRTDFAYKDPTSQKLLANAITSLPIKVNNNLLRNVLQGIVNAKITVGQRDKLCNSLRQEIQSWKTADPLQSLVEIPEKIEKFCEKQRVSLTNGAFLSDEGQKEHEMSLIYNILADTQGLRAKAMALRTSEADRFLTHLSEALDVARASPNNSPLWNQIDKDKFREECLQALRKLSCEAGMLPSCLRIDDVTILDSNIKRGGYGIISKGKWKSEIVAIKECKESGRHPLTMRKQIFREALLWHQLRHPNVVPFLGIIQQGDKLFDYSIVSKWMENGTLPQFLQQADQRNAIVSVTKLLYQVATGLNFLHEHIPTVIHGDIKGSNILVDGDGNALLSDFGISKLRYGAIDRTKTTAPDPSTLYYCSPELFDANSCEPTKESDVWAFGMVMWEAFTGIIPYSESRKHNHATIIKVITEKKLPPFPLSELSRNRGFNGELWRIMERCWEYVPKKRPAVKAVEEELLSLSEGLAPRPKANQRVMIPLSLTDLVVVPKDAPWKSLGIRLTDQGHAILDRIKYKVFQISGEPISVDEGLRRIERQIKELQMKNKAVDLPIPSKYRRFIVGRGGEALEQLRKRHPSVLITVPRKEAPNAPIKLSGFPEHVDLAKAEIEMIISRISSSFQTLTVSPKTGERAEQRCGKLGIKFHVEGNQIMMYGSPTKLSAAKNIIEALEAEADVVVDLNNLLCELIASDPRMVQDVIEKCEIDTSANIQINPSARGVEISGEPQLVSKVQGILQNMNSIGTSCVLGKGIKKYLHNKLLHKEEKLFLGFLEENKVMVFFPSSGGYGTIRMPDNMSQLKKDGWPSEEIVKIVGATADDCKRAEILLEERKNIKKKKMPVESGTFKVPPGLSGFIKCKLAADFRTLGVSVQTIHDSSEESMSLVLREEKRLVRDFDRDGRWKIFCRDHEGLGHGLLGWKLYAKTNEALKEASQQLKTELEYAWCRFGVLELSSRAEVQRAKDSLGGLKEIHGTNLTFEIIEKDKTGNLIIGGYSTAKVRESIVEWINILDGNRM